jgi:predicted nucleic acid-binding protein
MSIIGFPAKVIFDTSIYIPFINNGIAYPAFELKFGRPSLHLSSVVIEELYAGAFDNSSIKLLDRMYDTFENLGRIVVPKASDWQKAGKIISSLGQKYGFEDKLLARITNDVLIALSARQIGALVVTHNIKDFLRIKEFADFKLYGQI